MTDDPTAAAPLRHEHGGGREATVPPGLTRREHDMLAFERQWWRRAGAKDTAIRDRFGLPPVRYYQALNALVERPDALAADPLVIGRLRRVRAGRRSRRSPQVLSKSGSTL